MARGLSLAFEFAGAVFLFWLIGRLVDSWLGIEPWGQVVGSLIGWAGGFLHVYYATQRPSGRAGVPRKIERKGTNVPGGEKLSKKERAVEETDK
jgi:F0F1-type ATP synthase assembly protein I